MLKQRAPISYTIFVWKQKKSAIEIQKYPKIKIMPQHG